MFEKTLLTFWDVHKLKCDLCAELKTKVLFERERSKDLCVCPHLCLDANDWWQERVSPCPNPSMSGANQIRICNSHIADSHSTTSHKCNFCHHRSLKNSFRERLFMPTSWLIHANKLMCWCTFELNEPAHTILQMWKCNRERMSIVPTRAARMVFIWISLSLSLSTISIRRPNFHKQTLHMEIASFGVTHWG